MIFLEKKVYYSIKYHTFVVTGVIHMTKKIWMSAVNLEYYHVMTTHFPAPKEDLKHIDGLCRSLLWSGKEVVTKKVHVGWEVCWPKNVGGSKMMAFGYGGKS